jgi:hypothetical protein
MFTDHIPADATVRNLPDFHDTIFRPTSYNVVIMWTPGNIQYRPFVTTYQRMVCSNSSYLDKVITAIRTEVISTRTNLKVPTIFVHSIDKVKTLPKAKCGILMNTNENKSSLFCIYHLILKLKCLNNYQQNQSHSSEK